MPLNRSLEQTYSEFRPYQKDDEQIIQGLVDKEIVKIKIKETEIHQSLDENERSKRKELMKAVGLKEDKMDELAEQLDID